MNKYHWRRWMVAAAYGCFMTVGAMAQDHDHDHGADNGMAEGEMSPDAMMKAYEEAAKPGKYHHYLDTLEGKWNCDVKSYYGGPEPEVSTGSAEFHWVLDNHYMEQDYKGSMMGTPFTGQGIMGYDKAKKEYFSTWMDSMSTALFMSTGSCDDSGKTFTFKGQSTDPVSGQTMNLKSEMKIINKDKFVFSMFGMTPDGQEMPMMEITYTRS